jgi:pimeloyl-ACP methyl ester carboxylesterase
MIVRRLSPVLVMVLLAGCGGSGDGDGARAGGPSTSSATSSTPSASPTQELDPNGFPLADRPDCAADAGGEFVRATTSEGNGVAFLLLGAGPGGVVLGPQSDGDICQWLPYAEELATRYRVALFDWKEPRAEVPLLAVEALRAAGAENVVLAGASLGGAFALSEAHRVRPRLAGVLSFGGELTLPGFDGRPGIRQWHGPLLQISSRDDGYFDSRNARQLRVLHPGPETILMLPGSDHGVAMLDGPQQEQVRSTVDRFLARVLG